MEIQPCSRETLLWTLEAPTPGLWTGVQGRDASETVELSSKDKRKASGLSKAGRASLAPRVPGQPRGSLSDS